MATVYWLLLLVTMMAGMVSAGQYQTATDEQSSMTAAVYVYGCILRQHASISKLKIICTYTKIQPL